MKVKRYVMVGAAGFIASRHIRAIKETGGELVCIHDPNDSVGVIDSYFVDCTYFQEFERFDREIDRLRGTIDYLVVCSPNYMHDAHIRYGLRNGMNVICEKPLVLNPHNTEGMKELQELTGKSINVILQMRLHPEIKKLKQLIANVNTTYCVTLEYHTARGPWYHYSWKGDTAKSGGIATNIGVHLFDMLIWVFGRPDNYSILTMDKNRVKGIMRFEKADVTFTLNIDPYTIPGGGPSYRKIMVGENELDINTGFTDLHTKSYQEILEGRGWTIEDALPAIEFVSVIRKD